MKKSIFCFVFILICAISSYGYTIVIVANGETATTISPGRFEIKRSSTFYPTTNIEGLCLNFTSQAVSTQDFYLYKGGVSYQTVYVGEGQYTTVQVNLPSTYVYSTNSPVIGQYISVGTAAGSYLTANVEGTGYLGGGVLSYAQVGAVLYW